MRTILVIVVTGISIFLFSGNHPSIPESSQKVAGSSKDSINYQAQILPILQQRCTPCHFPGGKMYARLPFDQDTTIVGHEPGVMKRLKDENEMALIRKYIRGRGVGK